GAGEHRGLGAHFDRQPAVRASAVPGVLTLGVLADDDPVDVGAVGQRALDARKQARRTHVRVLVEALGYRQPQPPQRYMVCNLQAADGAEEDRIERPQPLQPAFGDVVAALEEVLGVPVETLDREAKAPIDRGARGQHLQPGGDHLGPYPVARDGGEAVFAHASLPRPAREGCRVHHLARIPGAQTRAPSSRSTDEAHGAAELLAAGAAAVIEARFAGPASADSGGGSLDVAAPVELLLEAEQALDLLVAQQGFEFAQRLLERYGRIEALEQFGRRQVGRDIVGGNVHHLEAQAVLVDGQT